MSGSVNRAVLIGHLGADPEVRTTQQGVKVVSFRLATSESWRDKGSGERKERVEWHSVTVWGSHDSDGLAGVAEKYLKKGSHCYLTGAIRTRKWQDKQGVDRYSTEIVLQGFGADLQLLDKSEGGGNRPPPPDDPSEYGRTSSRPGSERSGQGGAPAMGDDIDIPFHPEWR